MPAADSPLFPKYLQWLHCCEGIVMPPINTIDVQALLLPPERRSEEIPGQARPVTAVFPETTGECS